MSIRNYFQTVLLIPVFGAVISCGGGGSSKSSPTDPPASPIVYKTVTTDAGAGTSITPPSISVEQGRTAAFTVTLAAGYTDLVVTGGSGTLSGNTYTTGAITTDTAIAASATKAIITPPANNLVLSSIAITSPAVKRTYSVHDPLDISGLIVTGTYNDGSTAIVSPVNVTGFDSSAPVTGQTLTVAYQNKTTTFTVNINAVPVASVSVAPTPVKLDLNSIKTITFTPTVLPANATNKSVTWSSSNSGIASIDSTGLVTGKAIGGPVTITVTTANGNKTATAQITVVNTSGLGVTLSTNAYGVPANYTPQTITTIFKSPTNTTVSSTVWSSDNNTVASVDGTGLVTFRAPGTATVTCTVTDSAAAQYSATCKVRVFSRTSNNMQVGTNFWNLAWGSQCLDYVYPSLKDLNSWATVTNPWIPAFLTDLGAYNGPLRFMDFTNTNYLPVINWSERIQPTENWTISKVYTIDKVTLDPLTGKTVLSYYQPGTTNCPATVPAYEWMIDLCNRTGHDMWINIPTFSRNDQADINERYWTQLAKLINAKLDPNLKCFVEYSNETWNGGFLIQNVYTMDQGTARGLPGINKWYWGEAFNVLTSIKIFKAFEDEFGAANTGYDKRLVRVYATAGNSDGGFKAIRNVMYDGVARDHYTDANFNPIYNPERQKLDLMATAPYVGGMDGAASDIQTQFRAKTDWAYKVEVMTYINEMAKYGVKVGCYEGGQHLLTNAGAWSHNPAIYDEYIDLLDRRNAAGLVMFNHYTLYGVYFPGANTGAWGAKEKITDSDAVSPKFRALADWVAAHP